MSESVTPTSESPTPPAAAADPTAAPAAGLAEAATAIDKAAQTANEIVEEIQSVKGPIDKPTEKPGDVADVKEGSAGPIAPAPTSELSQLLAIEVPVIVQLGIRRMTVGEVMRFSVGAIIEFHKAADEELDLLANNKAIGKGHAVKVNENFGIKLTAIGPVKETIRKLGMP